MIVAYIRKIIERTDDVKQTIDKLSELAVKNTLKDWPGLMDNLKLPRTTSWENLWRFYHEDAHVHDLMNKSLREHKIAYLGEIAVHVLLGSDWHRVFEFNNPDVWGHQPDGHIGQESYDVKTRPKNEWGLTVYKKVLKDSYYVLGQNKAREDAVNLVGYATAAELNSDPRDKYGNFERSRERLHPIEFFKHELVHEGLAHICGNKWNLVSGSLP
jgi:hypothetical protein